MKPIAMTNMTKSLPATKIAKKASSNAQYDAADAQRGIRAHEEFEANVERYMTAGARSKRLVVEYSFYAGVGLALALLLVAAL